MARTVDGPEIASTWTLSDEDFRRTLNRGREQANRTARDVNRGTRIMQRGYDDAAKSVRNLVLAFGGLAAARAIVRGAITDAASLESAVAKIGTLGAEAASRQEEFFQGILRIGQQTGEEFDALASSLFDIISAGIEAGEAVAFLERTTELAVAGFTSTDVALQGILGTLKGFGLEANRAGDVADQLFQAMRAGRTDIAQLAANIGPVIPLARAAGLSFEEMFAAVSTLTLVTGNTSLAVTQLRSLLSGVAKSTDDATVNLAKLQEVGILDFLDELAAKTGLNTTVLFELLGRQEAVLGSLTLAADGAENFTRILEAAADASGVVAEQSDKVTRTFERESAIAKRTIQATLIELGRDVLPELGDALIDLASDFQVFVRTNKDDIGDFLDESIKNIRQFAVSFARIFKAVAPALNEFFLLVAFRVQFIAAKFQLMITGAALLAEALIDAGVGAGFLGANLGWSEEAAANFASNTKELREFAANLKQAGINSLLLNAEMLEGAFKIDTYGDAMAGAIAKIETAGLTGSEAIKAVTEEIDRAERSRTNRTPVFQINEEQVAEFGDNLDNAVKTNVSSGLAEGFQDGEDFVLAFGDSMTDVVASALVEAFIGDRVRSAAKSLFDWVQTLLSVGGAAAGAGAGAGGAPSIGSGTAGTGAQLRQGLGPTFFQHGGLRIGPTYAMLAEVRPERVMDEADYRAMQREMNELRRLAFGGGGGTQQIELLPGSIVERGFRESSRVVRAMQDIGTAPPTSLAQVRARRRR